MINQHYSFIILTHDEEIHLPRLLNSICNLNAAVYILDSGSTDQTIPIAQQFGAQIRQFPFSNHPQQWHHALEHFDIRTPWVIGLDADQILSTELNQLLLDFKDKNYSNIDGIYFNRKNYFKGKWIRHGGYFPFYQLKMFRADKAISDLNEGMDHRFIVNGKTLIWEKGCLIEENLKENNISFWINKHNTYSNLLAKEEIERKLFLRKQILKPLFWGNPDQKRAWLKKLWWQMPLFVRPALYFSWRYIFRLGILDGYQGFLFHFLQGFWFRLIVDVKIREMTKNHEQN